MITIDLRDEKLTKNLKNIQFLASTGMYTDEQIQQLYEEQVKKDAEMKETKLTKILERN